MTARAFDTNEFAIGAIAETPWLRAAVFSIIEP